MAYSRLGSGIDGAFVQTASESAETTKTNKKPSYPPWDNGPRQGRWKPGTTTGSFIDDQEVLPASTVATTHATESYLTRSTPLKKPAIRKLVDATANDRIQQAKRNAEGVMGEDRDTVAHVYDKMFREGKAKIADSEPAKLAKKAVSAKTPPEPVPNLNPTKPSADSSRRRGLKGVRIVGKDGRETFVELPCPYSSKKSVPDAFKKRIYINPTTREGKDECPKEFLEKVPPPAARARSKAIAHTTDAFPSTMPPASKGLATHSPQKAPAYKNPHEHRPQMIEREWTSKNLSPRSSHSNVTAQRSNVASSHVHAFARDYKTATLSMCASPASHSEHGSCGTNVVERLESTSLENLLNILPTEREWMGTSSADKSHIGANSNERHRVSASLDRDSAHLQHITDAAGWSIADEPKQTTYGFKPPPALERNETHDLFINKSEMPDNMLHPSAHSSSRHEESLGTHEHSFTRMVDLDHVGFANEFAKLDRTGKVDRWSTVQPPKEPLEYQSTHKTVASERDNPRRFAGHGWISPHPLSDVEGGKVQSEVTLNFGNELGQDKVRLSFDEWQRNRNPEPPLSSAWRRTPPQKVLHQKSIRSSEDQTTRPYVVEKEGLTASSAHRKQESSRFHKSSEGTSWDVSACRDYRAGHSFYPMSSNCITNSHSAAKTDSTHDIGDRRRNRVGDHTSVMDRSADMPIRQSQIVHPFELRRSQTVESLCAYLPPTVESEHRSQIAATKLHQHDYTPSHQSSSASRLGGEVPHNHIRFGQPYASQDWEEPRFNSDLNQPPWNERSDASRQSPHDSMQSSEHTPRQHSASSKQETAIDQSSRRAPSESSNAYQRDENHPTAITPVIVPLPDGAGYALQMPWDRHCGNGPLSTYRRRHRVLPNDGISPTPSVREPSATSTYGMSSLDRAERGHGSFGQHRRQDW